mmetsp:Transcript_3415/g.8292  ORF Transcript_3415/g.8292 Transcript_3415/m.8292 type:complete len:258 (-) Transcript_3415:107-880(-)
MIIILLRSGLNISSTLCVTFLQTHQHVLGQEVLHAIHSHQDSCILHLRAAELLLHLLAPGSSVHEAVPLSLVHVELQRTSGGLELLLKLRGRFRVREALDVVLLSEMALGRLLHLLHVREAIVPSVEGNAGIDLGMVNRAPQREGPSHAETDDSDLAATLRLEPSRCSLHILQSSWPVEAAQQVLSLCSLVSNLRPVEIWDHNTNPALGSDVRCSCLDLIIDAPPLLEDDQATLGTSCGGISGNFSSISPVELHHFS